MQGRVVDSCVVFLEATCSYKLFGKFHNVRVSPIGRKFSTRSLEFFLGHVAHQLAYKIHNVLLTAGSQIEKLRVIFCRHACHVLVCSISPNRFGGAELPVGEVVPSIVGDGKLLERLVDGAWQLHER